MKTHFNVIIVLLGCLFGRGDAQTIGKGLNVRESKANAIDVVKLYAASGWMGDGTKGTNYVQIDLMNKKAARPNREICIKVTYSTGPMKWAGMYWQNKVGNWGDKPGEDFSAKSFKKITFWAKGNKGGEQVAFWAGGISKEDKIYRDSFEITSGEIIIGKYWKQYELNIEGQNLSSVIGVFCWIINGTSSSGDLTFYLDDIRYE
jgi:hypothetical protein